MIVAFHCRDDQIHQINYSNQGTLLLLSQSSRLCNVTNRNLANRTPTLNRLFVEGSTPIFKHGQRYPLSSTSTTLTTRTLATTERNRDHSLDLSVIVSPTTSKTNGVRFLDHSDLTLNAVHLQTKYAVIVRLRRDQIIAWVGGRTRKLDQ